MIRTDPVLKLLAIVALTVAAAFAQSSDRLPVTDAEKIADALRAGPAFIVKNATLLDWPSVPGAEYRVLRKGSNKWTCLPSIPGYPHDEPGCFDPAFLQWMQDTADRAQSGAMSGSAAWSSSITARPRNPSAEFSHRTPSNIVPAAA